VLSRDALRRESGGAQWHELSFERALDAAVAEGRIRQLPFGFYGIRRR
jgi:hypothetical protein